MNGLVIEMPKNNHLGNIHDYMRKGKLSLSMIVVGAVTARIRKPQMVRIPCHTNIVQYVMITFLPTT